MVAIGLLLVALASVTSLASCRPAICEEPPPWNVEGEDLMGRQRGNVTVVALLMASWRMCLWQAEKLNDLQSSFLDAGIADVQTIIINNLHPGSQAMMRYLRRYAGEVPVYQDTNTSDVWQQLEGGKDDFFIYDRCGRLAYYVPMPLSLMFKPYALAAILSTYYDEPCGPCPQNPLNKTEEILCSAEENLINPNCTLPRANRTLEILNDTFNQDNNTISHLSQDAGQHNNTLKKYAGNALESLENSTDSPANQIHAFRNHPHRTDTGAADSTQKPEQHRHHSHHHHHHLHHHHSDPVDSRPHSSHQQNENDKQHSAATISTLTNRKNMTHPILTAGHTISSSSVTGQEKLKSEIHTHHHTTSGRGNGHAVSNVTQTSQNISESNEIISAHESKARIGTVRPTSKQIYDKYENYEMALQNALHTWLNRPIPNKVAIAKEENTTTTPVTTTATTTKKPRGRNRNRQNRRRKNRRKQTEDQSTPGHHHHHPWSQFDLSHCNDLDTKRQYHLAKECCRLEHSNRPGKILVNTRCEKMTEEKCKKIHLKNSCCKTAAVTENYEFNSVEDYDYSDSEELYPSEEHCTGFAPFFCFVLDVLRLKNISCCMNESLTLDPQEMSVICNGSAEIDTDVPQVILAIIYSKCQNHKQLIELWHRMWSSSQIKGHEKIWHRLWCQPSVLQSFWSWWDDTNRDMIWQEGRLRAWSLTNGQQPWSMSEHENAIILWCQWDQDVESLDVQGYRKTWQQSPWSWQNTTGDLVWQEARLRAWSLTNGQQSWFMTEHENATILWWQRDQDVESLVEMQGHRKIWQWSLWSWQNTTIDMVWQEARLRAWSLTNGQQPWSMTEHENATILWCQRDQDVESLDIQGYRKTWQQSPWSWQNTTRDLVWQEAKLRAWSLTNGQQPWSETEHEVATILWWWRDQDVDSLVETQGHKKIWQWSLWSCQNTTIDMVWQEARLRAWSLANDQQLWSMTEQENATILWWQWDQDIESLVEMQSHTIIWQRFWCDWQNTTIDMVWQEAKLRAWSLTSEQENATMLWWQWDQDVESLVEMQSHMIIWQRFWCQPLCLQSLWSRQNDTNGNVVWQEARVNAWSVASTQQPWSENLDKNAKIPSWQWDQVIDSSSQIQDSREIWQQFWCELSRLQSLWSWQNDTNGDVVGHEARLGTWSLTIEQQPWLKIAHEIVKSLWWLWDQDVNSSLEIQNDKKIWWQLWCQPSCLQSLWLWQIDTTRTVAWQVDRWSVTNR